MKAILLDEAKKWLEENCENQYTRMAVFGIMQSMPAVDYQEMPNEPLILEELKEMVQDHPDGMMLQNQIGFAANGLFCEWAWVIDLDKRTFEDYRGFGSEPLTEKDRFYFLRDLEENGYSGVRLVAEWSIDELPSDEDFLAAFKEDDEE